VLEGSFVTRPGLLHADVLSELQEVNRQYCLRHGYRFVTEVSTSSPPSPLSLSLSVLSFVSLSLSRPGLSPSTSAQREMDLKVGAHGQVLTAEEM